MNTDIIYLDDREHILAKPGMFIGDTTYTSSVERVWDGSQIQHYQINYSAGFERIFMEILHNTIDNAIISRAQGIDPGRTSITVSSDTIRIKNEGRPISVRSMVSITENGVTSSLPTPSAIFGKLRTSSNFSTNREVKDTSGTHGYGAKLTNVFSVYFNVECFNALEKVYFSQTWTDNMKNVGEIIIKPYDGTSSHTIVTFKPDFHRFGMSNIDNGCMALLQRHAIDAALNGGTPVSFNDLNIEGVTFDAYLKLCYGDSTRYMWSGPRSSIAIINSEKPSICYTNGVFNSRGGTHFEQMRNALVNQFLRFLHLTKPELKDKIKPAAVKKLFSFALVCRIDLPIALGQTKESIANAKLEEVPSLTEQQMKDMMNWSNVITFINSLEASMVKTSLPKTKKGKIPNIEKLFDAELAGTSQAWRCSLIITEGNGASNVALKTSEERVTGSLPLRGKFPNVSKMNKVDILKSELIIQLITALGLEIDKTYQSLTGLRYGKLFIMTDQDDDGMHIRMLLINFFFRMFPSLLELGFVHIIDSPYARIGDNIYVYSEREYREKIKLNPSYASLPYKKYKGLGTYSDPDIKAFRALRISFFPIITDQGKEMMSMAFNEKCESIRKSWIMNWDAKNYTTKYVMEYHQAQLPFKTEHYLSYMVAEPLCAYSVRSVSRAIPSIIDGLKESQRKIYYIVSNMKAPKRTNQVVGTIIDKTQYEHGEGPLEEAISRMASRSIYNNIPLVDGIGQFNNRTKTKSAAPMRYTHVGASKLAKFIFREEDNIILKHIIYANDEKIEPETYFPIIPPWAVNGVSGVATAFSTNIPSFNPVDIIDLFIKWCTEKGTSTRVTLTPFYKSFKGQFFYRPAQENKSEKFYSRGIATIVKSRSSKFKYDLLVTELPATTTISSYVKFLTTISRERQPKDTVKRGIHDFINSPSNEDLGDYIEILPNFTIIGADEFISVDQNGHLIVDYKNLKLETVSKTANVVFISEDGIPVIYKDVHAALSEFFIIRIKKYIERITRQIELMKAKVHKLTEKRRYINDIITGKTPISRNGKPLSKAEFDEVFRVNNYMPELRKLPYTTSIDDINKIDKTLEELNNNIKYMENCNHIDLYVKELTELRALLKKEGF